MNGISNKDAALNILQRQLFIVFEDTTQANLIVFWLVISNLLISLYSLLQVLLYVYNMLLDDQIDLDSKDTGRYFSVYKQTMVILKLDAHLLNGRHIQYRFSLYCHSAHIFDQLSHYNPQQIFHV